MVFWSSEPRSWKKNSKFALAHRPLNSTLQLSEDLQRPTSLAWICPMLDNLYTSIVFLWTLTMNSSQARVLRTAMQRFDYKLFPSGRSGLRLLQALDFSAAQGVFPQRYSLCPLIHELDTRSGLHAITNDHESGMEQGSATSQ